MPLHGTNASISANAHPAVTSEVGIYTKPSSSTMETTDELGIGVVDLTDTYWPQTPSTTQFPDAP